MIYLNKVVEMERKRRKQQERVLSSEDASVSQAAAIYAEYENAYHRAKKLIREM
jgi:hypothetical protein